MLDHMLDQLTEREIEIVTRLALAPGWSNKHIARSIKITEGTVKVHLHSIYAKLGLRGRGELIAWALRPNPQLQRAS